MTRQDDPRIVEMTYSMLRGGLSELGHGAPLSGDEWRLVLNAGIAIVVNCLVQLDADPAFAREAAEYIVHYYTNVSLLGGGTFIPSARPGGTK